MHSFSDKQIDIWSIQLDNPDLDANALRGVLSDDECKKADRYHLEKDRRCYTLTRGILRKLIAQYANCEPAELLFEYNEHGKPMLPGKPLGFNVSHSGNFAVIALAPNGNIGIDIERIRPDFDFKRILHRHFSAAQIVEIYEAPDPRTAFFQHWTLKEAFIKAIGSGVFCDLKSFDIPLGAPSFSAPKTHKEWQVKTLDVHPDFASSIIHDLRDASTCVRPYLDN